MVNMIIKNVRIVFLNIGCFGDTNMDFINSKAKPKSTYVNGSTNLSVFVVVNKLSGYVWCCYVREC